MELEEREYEWFVPGAKQAGDAAVQLDTSGAPASDRTSLPGYAQLPVAALPGGSSLPGCAAASVGSKVPGASQPSVGAAVPVGAALLGTARAGAPLLGAAPCGSVASVAP